MGKGGLNVHRARLHNTTMLGNGFTNKRIWRIELPENVRFFSWLVCRGVLPTNGLRVTRGMASSSVCDSYDDRKETLIHYLGDYVGALRVWYEFRGIRGSDEWVRLGWSKMGMKFVVTVGNLETKELGLF
ncbi:hypothetical protein RJT34_16796 [Clitoria ternatea]|uniref:Reverse transcriptase zinc-binding domain-containing protein n=1 Tax=Clitoria ternatea TaxID=43366 RepID=A0AAN9J818_CLITE